MKSLLRQDLASKESLAQGIPEDKRGGVPGARGCCAPAMCWSTGGQPSPAEGWAGAFVLFHLLTEVEKKRKQGFKPERVFKGPSSQWTKRWGNHTGQGI